MRRISAVALAAWTIAHTPACAWYDFAHMQTAAIAWSRLTPAARARASQLLKLNPMYAAWTRNVPARERDEIAFMMAAAWPDAIKRLGDYHADGPADGERPPPEPQTPWGAREPPTARQDNQPCRSSRAAGSRCS